MSDYQKALAAAREALAKYWDGDEMSGIGAAVDNLLAAIDAQQPLFLLHTGTLYGNERGDWEVEADSGKAVDAYCDANPGKTVALYAAPPALQAELDHARRRIGELAIQLGEAMKAQPAALANEVTDDYARDAARYRWLKANNIIRVFPVSSGAMRRDGTRILADTIDWLKGDFTYVIDGVTRDVDAAIDAAQAKENNRE